MSLGRRIELQIAALMILGGVLFGLGEGQPFLPLGLLLAAGLATRQVAGQPRFSLPAWAVNGLIFAIAIASGWRYAYAYGTGEVVVLGHAFGALQAVLVFERKTARTRWDLLSLSLLTVFLSTSLVQGPLFALGLLGYCLLAFSTLALICLEYERLASGGPLAAEPSSAAAGRVRGSWLRLLGIALSTLIVGPLALFLRFPERRVAASGRDATARLGEPGPRDEPAQWQAVASGTYDSEAIGRPFWWRMVGMTLSAFAVAVLLFCLAPRFGRVEFELPPLSDLPWRPGRTQPLRMVGFTDRVRLGELGALSDDQRMVFEFSLADRGGKRPYQPRGSIYLRGALLTEYRAGNWEFQPGGPPGRLRGLESEQPVDPDSLVRQRITVEPSDRAELFCVWPFLLIGEDPPVRFDSRSERLRRRRDMLGRSFTLEMATTAFQDGAQSAWTPCEAPIDEAVYLRWPQEALPGLARLAQRWLSESRIPAADPTARARWLQRQFLESGRFRYAFEESQRNTAADPMEDFVTLHPEGNCEYFASALALMLRSQGIPSRLVVGFKADAFSESSGTYRVRQTHAHAWVEAYVPADRLPTGAVRQDGISDWSLGAWLRLDPTPVYSSAPTGVARQMEDWLSLLHSFWRDHVLSMSGAHQREVLYRPLVTRVRQTAADLSDPSRWEAADVQSLLRVALGMTGAAIFCGILVVGAWLLRVGWGTPRQGTGRIPRGGTRTEGSGRSAVAFYTRFESLLARFGQRRSASQTPREFAEQAAKHIASAWGDAQMTQWAREIVQAFYEVRFGGGILADDQAAAVEAALQRLQQAGRPEGHKNR
jgi:protein-glutamine gamma-glutamyltransferase